MDGRLRLRREKEGKESIVKKAVGRMKYIKMKFLYLCLLLACPESTIVITDLSQLKKFLS